MFLRVLIFSLWFLPSGLFAQKNGIFNFGNKKRQDQMADACRAQSGGILSCGSAESEDGEGLDALLIKTNHLGTGILRKRIGVRTWNEHALAVAEDAEGKIWVGGYSDSIRVNRAWMMCFNPAGGPVWDRQLYKTYDIQSSVQDILPGRNAKQMALAGVSGGRAWFGLWGLNGEKKFEPKKVERIDGHPNFMVEKVVLVEGKNAWYLYGSGNLPGTKRQLFFIKLNEAGEAQASILLSPDEKILSSGGCTLTTGGNLLGVGTADVPPFEEEAFTVYIPENFDRQDIRFQTFGGFNALKHKPGKGMDEALDIIPIDEKTCLVAGSTKSHVARAQVPDFAAWRVDHYGQRLDDDMLRSGDVLAEQGIKALRMYSGQIWICGNENDGSRSRNHQIFAFNKLDSVQLLFTAADPGTLGFKVPEQVSGLQAGGTAALSVEIHNQSSNLVEGLFVTGDGIGAASALFKGLRYALPPLPAGQKFVANMPLWAERETVPGENKLTVKLHGVDGQVLSQKTTTITIGAGQAPQIRLLSAVSARSKKPQLVKGKKTYIELSFRNDGDADANDVTISFSEPDAATLAIEKDYRIPVWKMGTTQTFQIALTANGFGTASNIPLKVFISATGLIDVPPFQINFEVVDQELTVYEPENINSEVDLEIQWNDGDDKMDRRTNREKFELHTQIFSNVKISMDDLWLIHTYPGGRDSIRFTGVKSDDIQFKKMNASDALFIYSASQLLYLKPGDNVLQIWVEKNQKSAATAPMTVKFTAYESTLHIVSIGVPDEANLIKYTQNDAVDIARLFYQQENRLYGTVKTTVLTSKDSTRGAVLSGVLNSFKEKQLQGLLKPTDAILVFISTHGIISDQDNLFRLEASDFNRSNEKYTSLSFKDDVLGVLGGLGCQVFVMLDACHSEAAEGLKGDDDIAGQIIEDFNKATKRVRLIASCRAKESSYEHKNWENSAFAQALINILGDRSTCISLDTDGNKYLTLKELFVRLPQEVNTLVRSIRKGETQTPYISQEVLEEQNPVPFWGY